MSNQNITTRADTRPEWLRVIVQLPRVLATGFCFAVFFLGGLLVSLTVVPAMHIGPSPAAEKQRRCRYCVHLLFRSFVWLLGAFHLIKVTMHEKARLNKFGGGLIVANHPTLIDVVSTIAYIPNATCIAKQDMFRNPYVRRVVSACGYISNENGESLLAGAKQALDSGIPIVVFPEGSRTVPGQTLQFKRGPANIAVRTNAPILPVFITCRPITLTKGAPWWAVPKRQAHIDLWVQEAAKTEDFVNDLDDAPAAARRFNKALLHYFEEGLTHV